ncbi:MAG: M28 family peptidase [Verrucomicrobiales bacterium]|nr:M28 family peptidase [Verrucomicrobiales bacterium]
MTRKTIFHLTAIAVFTLGNVHSDESAFLSGTRQLTFEGKRSGEGYFSADGKKIIFQSERESDNPFYQIYLMDLETGDVDKVSPGHGKTTCAWIHPSGKKVMFASTQDDAEAIAKQKAEIDFRNSGKTRRYSWDYDEEYDIFEYDLETGKYTNLTKTKGYDAEGAYSPDGKHIVFASNRQAYDGSLNRDDQMAFKLDKKFPMEIYISDVDGSNTKRLTNADGYDGGPFFSFDGKQICWRRFDKKAPIAEIYTMNIDGSDQRQLTSEGVMSWAPFFHPSGEYLIYVSNALGYSNFELFLVRADGQGKPVRVTYTDDFDSFPVFSPDGEKLSWTSKRAGKQSQIFLAGWNHEAARKALGLEANPLQTEVPAKALPETAGDITAADLKAHLEYLASPELKGRLTGTEGEQLATAYAADYFKSLGLAPGGDNDSYFQEFEFTAGVAVGEENDLKVMLGGETIAPKLDEEWRPISFSRNGEFAESGVVFAGYGIELPKDEYSSYFHLDVKGKWVMVMRYFPEDAPEELRQKLRRFAGTRHKANVARRKFAAGIIYVTGPNTEVENELVPMEFDASLANSGIPAITISTDLATRLIKSTGKDFAELQKSLDGGEMVQGFDIPDAQVRGAIDVDQEKKTGRNVIAVLDAKQKGHHPNPALLIGAHIDHLGPSAGPGSLAKKGEKDQIHFGADDNASGTAGLLEIAEYLADQHKRGKLKLTRDIVFACWSGEEIGLLGSSHFIRKTAKDALGDSNAPLNLLISSYLNMDMIGRLDESVVLQGAGSSDYWRGAIEQRNVPVGLSINVQNDVYLPTDAINFYMRNVPILNAFTGSHSDYHTPRDVPSKINYEGARDISKLFSLIARGLATSANSPMFKKVDPPKNQGARGFRVKLGTIPDYSQTDIKGVKLSGVADKGPADLAGVKGGDIIVGLDGKALFNIYDYTDAIAGLKVGKETEIVVKRGEEELKLKITPASRD